MWWKLAIGGLAGLLIGSVAPAGYALWIALGIVAGYAVDAWQHRRSQAPPEQNEDQGR